MKLIPLTQGKFAKVSDHQFERIAQFGTWFYNQGYAKCKLRGSKGKIIINMQDVVLPYAKTGEMVDHIDGDGLNNQDDNLRCATKSQQAINRRTQENNTTGVRGVYAHKSGKWQARIYKERKVIRTQLFETFEEAVMARQQWETEVFGDFMCQNPERPLTKFTLAKLVNGERREKQDVNEGLFD